MRYEVKLTAQAIGQIEEIVQYIMTIIPQEEGIVEATRKSVGSFPEIAIRELLANAMIHQDLQQRGTNPMVEVF